MPEPFRPSSADGRATRAVYAGVVVLPGGTPLREAGIFADPAGDKGKSLHLWTDADGSFSMNGLGGAEYSLRVTSNDELKVRAWGERWGFNGNATARP